ncbi:MAG: protein kinase [Planctomycetota bacterium]|nr:protein kinase [Planctomycetota bacterium]
MKSDDLLADQSSVEPGTIPQPKSGETGTEVPCSVGAGQAIGPVDQIHLRQEGESGSDGNFNDADAHRTHPILNDRIGAAESAADLEGIKLDRFQLDNEIARGGMGIIFAARDLHLDRAVAVKILLKKHQDKPLLRQQFVNEALISGRLQHPGIIPIYETGTFADERPYFAMKLVKGNTLAELLNARSQPQNELPRLLKVFEQVCQTVSYTHSCGVIHLDIKPGNIMVGTFGEVHVMDWGLAKASTELYSPSNFAIVQHRLQCDSDPTVELSGLTSQNLADKLPSARVWGTPAYMSPEQARGHYVDVRSDVFCLGGILGEILTGYPPYRGKNLVDVCFKAAEADLRELHLKLIESGAGGVLVRLAMKCLSPNPDDRPMDARIVALELTLYLESLMRRAESDLERFFELSFDMFCIAGFDGYFRRVNSNFPRILGHTEKVLTSRPFLEFVHPDDREGTIHVMSQLHLGLPVVQFQNRYIASDGSWRKFEWTAKSIPEDSIIFAVARDVTSLRDLEAEWIEIPFPTSQ